LRKCTNIKSLVSRKIFDTDHDVNLKSPPKENEMKLLAIPAALLPALGALALMGTVATTTSASARCMIDEGNGRLTPCQALYTSKRCMIDEGNGRFTPCQALAKPKKTGKKG
jgi:hypothetical protein